MARLVKQGFPSSPVLLREFTINGRCAVKGSARGDGKKERGETPFHRPPSHHPSRSLRSRSLEFRFPTCDPNKIRVKETNCAIQWIKIYPVDSVIHLLNTWGQDVPSDTSFPPIKSPNDF